MKYYTDINLKDFNNSHTIAYYYVESIAQGRKLEILEVGCSAGYFGSLLCKSGHIVWGVEPDKESSSEAEKSLNYVLMVVWMIFFPAIQIKNLMLLPFGIHLNICMIFLKCIIKSTGCYIMMGYFL